MEVNETGDAVKKVREVEQRAPGLEHHAQVRRGRESRFGRG